jgi:hypothetical protein
MLTIATSIPSRKIAPHSTNSTPHARGVNMVDPFSRTGYRKACRFLLVTSSILGHHR